MLKDNGLENARGVPTPIGEEANEVDETDENLPDICKDGKIAIKNFQFLVGSLLWLSRYSRPDISYAVHRVSRRTHSPTIGDWKLAQKNCKISARN